MTTTDTIPAAPAPADHADKPYRLPDGPKTPELFNGIAFLVARNRLMRRLQRRYGDIFTMRMPGFGQMVVVTRPDQVKQVYTAKPDVLHAGKNPLGEILGPGSLFSMDEERHLRERRMLLPPFHGERMRSYEAIIEEEALRAMARWPEGVEFASIESFQTITLRIILRTVFGAEGQELAELEKLLPPMTTVGQRLVTLPILRRDRGRRSPGGRWKRMHAVYRRLVDKLVDDHLADPGLDERIDILAMILREKRDEGGRVDHSDVADELLTLLVAGHETTASALAWSVERLRRHPEVLRRLEEEARGDDNALRAATAEEVLRVRPVINATARLVVKPFEIDGWRMPPGSRVVTGIALMHADGRFHEEADTFSPTATSARNPTPTPGPRSAAGCDAASAPPSPSSRSTSSCAPCCATSSWRRRASRASGKPSVGSPSRPRRAAPRWCGDGRSTVPTALSRARRPRAPR